MGKSALQTARLINTSPLLVVLTGLCRLIELSLQDAREVLAISAKIKRTVRRLIRIERYNARIRLKQKMLATPQWRAQVLAELGGLAALERWERLMMSAAARLGITTASCITSQPHPSLAQRLSRRDNLIKARQALREKHRQSFRHKPYDRGHPKIYRDPVKLDQSGQFRLAPIPRPRIKPSSDTQVTTIKLARTNRAYERETAPRSIRKVKLTRVTPIALYPWELHPISKTTGSEASLRPHVPPNIPPNIMGCDIMKTASPRAKPPLEPP